MILIEFSKLLIYYNTNILYVHILLSKIEVPGDVRNVKSENMTSSGKISLNIRTNASPKWDRTMCPEE